MVEVDVHEIRGSWRERVRVKFRRRSSGGRVSSGEGYAVSTMHESFDIMQVVAVCSQILGIKYTFFARFGYS